MGSRGPLDDHFQGATVHRPQDATFDANAYSFFAAPTGNGDLGGALEDGLEAPPEEDSGLHEGLGDELEAAVPNIGDDLDGITDYTVAGMFKAESELDQDLDPALLEARSLPRDMFAGEDEEPTRVPSQTHRPLHQPSLQQLQLTPPPKRSTPMTLAELEAQMAASTPQPQSHLQPQQPIMLSPEIRPPMQGMQLQAGLRGTPHPQPFFHQPGMNGAPPGMGMHPPGMHPSPHPHPPPQQQHPHQGMVHGSHGPPMHPSPMQPGSMHPGSMFPSPMQQPMHHMSPMQPGAMPLSPLQPGPGHPSPMHTMHGGSPHMFPPSNGLSGMRGMMMGPHTPGTPGMHMNHMRLGGPPGMAGGPPGMMWQHQPGGHQMSPLPPHMQQRMGPPGMGPPDSHMQNAMHMPGVSWSTPDGRPGPSPGMGRDTWPGSGTVGGGGQSMSLSRPRFQGKLMSAFDVEHIMNILYSAVHAGAPYHEDYYYQAYVNQVTNGRNAGSFKPEELRSLRPDVAKLDPSASVKFAAVHGLGKIVLTNIRTPKVLMDLTSPNVPNDTDQTAAGPQASTAPMRPLEQEPLLAARIMVEDCHDKLLDVDDIDRCFAAAAQMAGGLPEDPASLRTRRALLAASVTAAFRLPTQPSGADADASGAGAGDRVLMNIMTIPKGRSMMARALRVLLGQPHHASAPTSNPALASPEHLLWALLRNAYEVFGASISDGNVKSTTLQPLVEATHRVAAAAKDAILQLATPQQAVDAMSALLVSMQARITAEEAPGASPMDAVLPLAQVRLLPHPMPEGTPSDWCGEVLVTLLQRGAHLGIGEATSEGGADMGMDASMDVSIRWHEGCGALVRAFLAHVSSLAFLQTEMTKAARGQGTAPAPEALAAVKALACRPLAQQLLGLITNSADADLLKQQLRQLL